MAEARPCSVCSHPSRLAIEQALVNGKGLRPVARDFGIGSGVHGTDSFRADHKKLERHRDRCMKEAYHRAREAGEVEAGAAIATRLNELDGVLDEVIARLRAGEVIMLDGQPLLNEDGSLRRRWKDTPLLMAVNEARHNLELRHKIAGALSGADEDGLDAARQALATDAGRKALQELEETLARIEAEGAGKGA